MATIDPDTAARAAAALPDLPRDGTEPVFREPWEARAFALAVALHEGGVFSWSEWAAALADEIARAQHRGENDPPATDAGEAYYRHWLAALERLVTAKRVTSAATLERTRVAWDHAADRTPHGMPIELQPGDFPNEPAG